MRIFEPDKERAAGEERSALEQNLTAVKAPPDRIDRLKALLSREGQMLQLVNQVHQEVEEIHKRRMAEQKTEGL